MPKKLFPAFVGDVIVGSLAVVDDMIVYLTDCCDASVTGVSVTEQNTYGIACRKCYHPQPKIMANAWMATDRAQWEKWAAPFTKLFDAPEVDKIVDLLMAEALMPDLDMVANVRAWEDIVNPRLVEATLTKYAESTQLIFRPRVPAAQQTVIAIVEHHDISDRIEQTPELSAENNAAQLTGMLFADQPETGMLF